MSVITAGSPMVGTPINLVRGLNRLGLIKDLNLAITVRRPLEWLKLHTCLCSTSLATLAKIVSAGMEKSYEDLRGYTHQCMCLATTHTKIAAFLTVRMTTARCIAAATSGSCTNSATHTLAVHLPTLHLVLHMHLSKGV